MKKISWKKFTYYTVCLFISVFCILYLYNNSNINLSSDEDEDLNYVSRLFASDEIPVMNTTNTIMRPYNNSSVKIVQGFYNYQGNETEQENSITNYEQTYIQNSGVAYGGLDGDFDVIASLPGKVTEVKQDDLLGGVVVVEYSDKVTVTYESLSDIKVSKDAQINQGDVIGVSGNNKMNKDLKSHLVFSIQVNGEYVNPEDYYDKNADGL